MANQLIRQARTTCSRLYHRLYGVSISVSLFFVPSAYAQGTTGLDGLVDEIKTILFDLGSVAVLIFKAFVVLGAAYMVIAGLLEARSKKDGWGDYFLTAVMVVIGAILAYYLLDLADEALANLKAGASQ